MRPSKRLQSIPPYLFAELERKVAEKKAQGVISHDFASEVAG